MAALVIIGGGLAGAKAAEAARGAGYDGRVIVVGDEAHPPYERPPLSKSVLRGEADVASANVHDDHRFYEEHGIELIAGEAVTSIDPAARRVRLESGSTLEFARAVLATGASPRTLAVPGADLDGVHHLRTRDDALALRDAIRGGGRVAVIGAGWIGSEVAASAREMGAEVVLIDPAPVPLRRVVGEQVGALFTGLHREHGVTLRLGSGVRELRGHGSVEEVVLTDGRVEAASIVVAGIGVTPNVALAEQAGLVVADGVVVDEHLEAGGSGIYAAGDVASAYHPHYRRHLRVEHWSTALNQGGTAGRNAAGAGEVYDRLPYFFSDQYDLGLEYVGHGHADDVVVLRGDAADRKLIVFWLRQGRVTAAMNVNVWDVADDLKAIVASTRRADPDRLADPAVALSDLG
jgi:3-phenylpropionate/trans-cinnamate dioxygenase ferredoxin reductase component